MEQNSPKTDPHIHGQLFFDKGTKAKWKKDSYSKNGAGTIRYPYAKKRTFIHISHTIYKKT